MATHTHFKYILILSFILSNYLRLASVIDADLLESFVFPSDTADILIDFAGGNSQAIKNIESKSFPDDDTRAAELCANLQTLANFMQEPLVAVLGNLGIQSQSFWSSNQMVIKNANLPILQLVDLFPQVSRVQRLPTIKLDPVPSSVTPATTNDVTWGVAKIEADKAWSITRGEKVVVCNIDTGVRGTHEILKENLRSDYGWFDPYNKTEVPSDDNGHGTHTMGTICGKNGYGVAPEANWIACQGCDGSGSCNGDMILACGQWCLQPTKPDGKSDPDASKRPHVVSCSWGSIIGGSSWFNGTIAAWTACGILHAFALGNSGPACVSAGSPGDQEGVFGVGSTDSNDRLSVFSSKGPFAALFSVSTGGLAVITYTKPDISAPGSDIKSCWNTGDKDYNTISGTSMATPHVAGTIALMCAVHHLKHKNTRLKYDDMITHITGTTDTHDLTLGTVNVPCDLAGSAKTPFPNNEFGCGRVNALKAVESVVKQGHPSDIECRRNTKEIIIIKICFEITILGIKFSICFPPALPSVPELP